MLIPNRRTAPFIFALLHRFPNHRRYFTVAGQIITVIALIGASFASKVWHLILTQGVLYAVGGSLLYFPTVAFLDEWFIKRKGFAFGVMWAGAGGINDQYLGQVHADFTHSQRCMHTIRYDLGPRQI